MLEKVSTDIGTGTTTTTDLDTTLVGSVVPVESMSGKCVRYNYRLRVSNKMQRLLLDEWNTKRWVWNRCVQESQKAYAEFLEDPNNKRDLSMIELSRMLTIWRSEHDWLRAGSSVVQQQTVRDFPKARSKAIKDIAKHVPQTKRRGMPRFKSKHRDQPSLGYTLAGFSLKTYGEDSKVRVHLASGIVVRPVWSRPLPTPPSSLNIYRDATGAWWISFVVKVAPEPLPATNQKIGIDWGVNEIATTTDTHYDLSHPEYGKKAQKALANGQRKMAKRKPEKGHSASKGYKDAKRQVALSYQKVARQRQDTARKWAKHVVRDHDEIAAEDFYPKFISKTTMARKALDGTIAATKAELIYMADKHQRVLVLVNPSKTTMECSVCGAIAKHRLELSERVYTCEVCGLEMPRDKNSAKVMLNRAGFDPVVPKDVRLGSLLKTHAA